MIRFALYLLMIHYNITFLSIKISTFGDNFKLDMVLHENMKIHWLKPGSHFHIMTSFQQESATNVNSMHFCSHYLNVKMHNSIVRIHCGNASVKVKSHSQVTHMIQKWSVRAYSGDPDNTTF